MEIRLHVQAKVETEFEEGVKYTFHVMISVDREDLAAQGGGTMASFKVDKSLWDATNVGDDLVFIHNNTVNKLKVVG